MPTQEKKIHFVTTMAGLGFGVVDAARTLRRSFDRA